MVTAWMNFTWRVLILGRLGEGLLSSSLGEANPFDLSERPSNHTGDNDKRKLLSDKPSTPARS